MTRRPCGSRPAPSHEATVDEFDGLFNLNVKGVWQCCKAAVGPMREAGGGSMINISTLAFVYGTPYAIDYAASKGAVIGITRVVARELGRDWIRVNAVAPTVTMRGYRKMHWQSSSNFSGTPF